MNNLIRRRSSPLEFHRAHGYGPLPPFGEQLLLDLAEHGARFFQMNVGFTDGPGASIRGPENPRTSNKCSASTILFSIAYLLEIQGEQ